jgi:hypothetical protein
MSLDVGNLVVVKDHNNLNSTDHRGKFHGPKLFCGFRIAGNLSDKDVSYAEIKNLFDWNT